jgi:FAD/FMN-containing dehydrogenase
MSDMNRILEIRHDPHENKTYVTAEAGALYIDVALELQKRNLQFYVNIELGNLSMGSAACGGTKDASMPGEFGQVNSYVVAVTMVTPVGEIRRITPSGMQDEQGNSISSDPDLIKIVRSSYGLLGIICEVTMEVKPLQRMAVQHRTYNLSDFQQIIKSPLVEQQSFMFYIFPSQNRITVELRQYQGEYDPQTDPLYPRSWRRIVWRLRNFVWKRLGPGYGYWVTRLIRIKPLRYFLVDCMNTLIRTMLTWVIHSKKTIPTDQLIRYPGAADESRYTFTLWAFPEERYGEVLEDYFKFYREYYRTHQYRNNLLHVGYRVRQDQQSLFSYSYNNTVLTIDPVSTGDDRPNRDEGWNEFLKAYNQFCIAHDGTPLFNQTKWVSPQQAHQALNKRLTQFEQYRRTFDPENRLLNQFFKERLDNDTHWEKP